MRMKFFSLLMIAVFLFFTLISLAAADVHYAAAAVEKLAVTDTSWDGSVIPWYPRGNPETTALRITIPPGLKLPMHKHPVQLVGYVLKGELTIDTDSGERVVLSEGEPLIEVRNTWHNGMNLTDEPVELVVFYMGVEGTPNTINAETGTDQDVHYATAKVETLTVSGKSWNGADQLWYPWGNPQVTVLNITVPPEAVLSVHRHPIPLYGYVLEGALTIETDQGDRAVFSAGEPIIEVVETWHNGKNEGSEPLVLIAFYMGVEGVPNTINLE